jgi:hypothetical protein
MSEEKAPAATDLLDLPLKERWEHLSWLTPLEYALFGALVALCMLGTLNLLS